MSNRYLFRQDWKPSPIETDGVTTEIPIHIFICKSLIVDLKNIDTYKKNDAITIIDSDETNIVDTFSEISLNIFNILRAQSVTKEYSICIQIFLPFSLHSPTSILAGLSGLLKSANKENSRVNGQILRIDHANKMESILSLSRINAQHINDDEISYVGHKRSTRVWFPVDETNVVCNWKNNSYYIISGGLGELGLIFANDIARNTHGTTIYLTGRTKFENLPEDKLLKIKSLGCFGSNIIYKRIDVSDNDEVDALVSDLKSHTSSIHCIIHSAGVVDDRLLVNKTEDSIQRVYLPKLKGITNLETKTRDILDGDFITFSSAASALGNIGQSDYAAANGFMDAYTNYRNSFTNTGNSRMISINWPLWRDGGMSVNKNKIDLMGKSGVTPLSSSDGISALKQIQSHNFSQVLVLSGTKSKIFPLLSITNSNNNIEEVRNPTSSLPDHPSKIDGNTISERIQHYLCATVNELLKVPHDNIDINAPLEKYGIDSIMVIEITSRLEGIIGQLSKTLLFEYQTISELSGYLVSTHKKKVEQVFGIDKHQEKNDESSEKQNQTKNTTEEITTNNRKTNSMRSKTIKNGRHTSNSGRRFFNNTETLGDIAVIGLSGKYPKSKNIDEFWDNLSSGNDCITEVPKGRWDHTQYYHHKKGQPNRTYTKWGGFIDGVDQFDARFFNISPKEASRLDPQERLFLQCAYSTVEDAGYTRSSLSERDFAGIKANIGVYVGVMYNEYQLFGAQAQSNDDQQAFAATPASIANRVSYFMNFHGPSMVIDTMCSSSLTSIHLACESLRTGSCDMAIAGGVNLSIHPNKYLLLGYGQFASSKGLCESFGNGGDGYVPGEGVGAVLLKPLERAQRENDHIYGVIKASGINHGGKTNGYTVPNPNAQASVISHALSKAKINPRAISYIEAHGTGTALGDPIEITGLNKAFIEHTNDKQFCSIGSVKSNIGHCESAAGIAGLTKILLQFKHKTKVKSLHCEEVNPNINFDNTPFSVQKTKEVWKNPYIDGVRQPLIAGLSSFGAGGANAHLIISEYRDTSIEINTNTPAIIMAISAQKKSSLDDIVHNLLYSIDKNKYKNHDLIDIAYTLQVGRDPMNHRLSFVCNSIESLNSNLANYLDQDTLNGSLYYNQVPNDHIPENYDGDYSNSTSDNELNIIAKKWSQGFAIKWEDLYKKRQARKISLPSYPFSKTRHWITDSYLHNNELSTSHSLIDFTPNKTEKNTYNSILDGSEFFLLDHKVKGVPVLPGVVYAEIVYKILNDLNSIAKNTVIQLQNLVWIRPLSVSKKKNIKAVINKQQGSSFEFKIYAQDYENNSADFINHCNGIASIHTSVNTPSVDLHQFQALCNKQILQQSAIYQNFHKIGIDYGPSHQAISSLQLGEEKVFAHLSLPSILKESYKTFHLHPGLLDSALQATIGLKWGEPKTALPFTIEKLTHYSAIPEKAYVVIRYSDSHNPESKVSRIDIDITDSEGKCCVSINNYSSRLLINSIVQTEKTEPTIKKQCGGSPYLNRLTELISQLLEVPYEDIESDVDLSEYGFDSVSFTKLVNIINEETTLSLSPTIFFEYPTLSKVSKYLSSELAINTIKHGKPKHTPQSSQQIEDSEHNDDINHKPNNTPFTDPNPNPHILSSLTDIVCEILETTGNDIESDIELSEYGFDSIGFTSFAKNLNALYSLALTPTIFFEHPTLDQLSLYLQINYPSNFLNEHTKKPNSSEVFDYTNTADDPVHNRNPISSGKNKEPIAIIGMSGKFPQSENLEEFWENLLAGKDCIREVPKSRWDWQKIFGDPKSEPGKTNIKWGGFIDGIEDFDPLFFGISPKEAAGMDPHQRLLMTYAWKALEDAGYSSESIDDTDLALFIGTGSSGYNNLVTKNSADIKGFHATSSVPSIGPNRMSYMLNVHGPSEPIETACSSSLVAIHKAVQLLRSGDSEMAIVGGINTLVTPTGHISFGKAGMLSEDGRCKTFSNQANGYVRGEGVGMLVLKPLSLAEKDGDNIYALIRGSAQNHGGRSQSLTAPSTKSQTALLKKAYKNAHIDVSTIGYIEAHGTGTSLGDPIEIDGLKQAFSGDPLIGHCALGSVKTNIGHLELSAGVAGIIKTVLQLKHQTLVKSLHSETLNPYIKLENSPFFVVQKNQHWPQLKDSNNHNLPRRAGVSSFGFGGVNAHVILEEYAIQESSTPENSNPPNCIILSAKTSNSLKNYASQLLLAINNGRIPPENFTNLAYTLQIGRDAMEERLGFVANNLSDVTQILSTFLSGDKSVSFTTARRDKKNSKLPTINEKMEYANYIEAWVSGRTVNWQQLYTGVSPKRISCPTYPFENQRCWVGSQVSDSQPYDTPIQSKQKYPVKILHASDSTPPSITQPTEIVDIKLLCLQFVKSIMSRVLDIPEEKLDTDRTFDDYGVDSIVVVDLADELNKTFRSIDGPILFDNQCIEDLVQYILKNEAPALNSMLTTRKASTSVEPENHSPPVPPTESSDTSITRTNVRNENTSRDIAIIGITGRYAKSSNIEELWQNLKTGKNCISEVPKDRWDWKKYYTGEKGTNGSVYTKWGGFMDDVDKFDPYFFSITPKVAELMDPQERVFLEAAYHCIEDSGYTPKSLDEDGKVGVFCGLSNGNYATGVRYWSIPNRVSYLFDFNGPSIAIDSACSSSLTAIDSALDNLERGRCNIAIAGGINLIVDPAHYRILTAATMLSSGGECKAFGEGADGFIDGEGVGAIILKPLLKAERDGDNIYGVIKGSMINAGGRTSGFTVPSVSAQSDVISDALADANIDPSKIDYLEAHGTGTPLGDPIEISGLTKAFRKHTNKTNFCPVGSIKTNIGHCESAAGIAGITKVLLQFKHDQLVPSINSKTINPRITLSESPFYIQQNLTTWKRPIENGKERPRVASVSSFGAGGSNAHIVIEEYVRTKNSASNISEPEPQLIVLSAKTPEKLKERAQILNAYIKGNDNLNINDLAYTLQVGREAMDERLAFIVDSTISLTQELDHHILRKTSEINNISASKIEYNNDDIITLAKEKNLNKLLTLWLNGAIIPWNILHHNTEAKRVSLPKYPFTKERYWIYSHYASGHNDFLKIANNDKMQCIGVDNTVEHSSPYTDTQAHDNSIQDICYLIPNWTNVAPKKSGNDFYKHYVLLEEQFVTSANTISATGIHVDFISKVNDEIGTSYKSSAIQTLALLKRALRDCKNGKILLQVVTSGPSRENINQGLVGMLRTARKENPKLFTQLVAIDQDTSNSDITSILRENARSSEDLYIRYNKGRRQLFSWHELPDKNKTTPPWKNQGAYLITGGAGGLGYLFACDIAEKSRGANLLLTGRSPINNTIQNKIGILKEKGANVEYHVADVCDMKSIQRLATHIKHQFGHLDGIIHSAGLLKDSFILTKKNEDFSSVLDPKVRGVLNLDEATQDILTGNFILFGSSAGAFGNIGQVDYACANAFMDWFSEYRNDMVTKGDRKGRSTSIDWPLWRDGGMHVDETKIDALNKIGLQPLENKSGVYALYRVIESKQSQIAIFSGDLERIRNLVPLTEKQITSESHTNRKLVEEDKRNVHTTQSKKIDSTYLEKVAETYVKSILQEVSKLSPEKVSINVPIQEYGIDSIAITKITNALEDDLGPLPKTLIFEYPNVATLAQYLVDNHEDTLTTLSYEKLYLSEQPNEKHNIYDERENNQAVTQQQEHIKPREKNESTSTEKYISESTYYHDNDIAIIGVAGSYPESESLDDFWVNLKQGRDCVTKVPEERWDYENYFGSGDTSNGGKFSKWGGFLKDIDKFDPLFFKQSPIEATATDPQERLFLMCAYHAIEDAGYTRESLSEAREKSKPRKVGVYAGVSYHEYQMLAAQTQLMGNKVALFGAPASIANRVSFAGNFNGPSMTIDTMCSSSLTSIHLACESLRSGSCKVAIAGGINLQPHPNKYILLGQSNFTSSNGRCQAFGKDGDGYVPSEGVGVVILKPLIDAVQDGDSIKGVIKSCTINHGGKASNFTVPNPASQAQVVTDAIEESGIDPNQLSYIEAHGTGTSLGDPIEIRGLSRAFGQYTKKKQFCAIGSVKSNIGHCESAAGMAGLTKILLQMKNKTLVPSIHCDELNPNIDFQNSPFTVQREISRWDNSIDDNGDRIPLTAGLSSFGAGGSNAHLIVSEYINDSIRPKDTLKNKPIVLSARTPERLKFHVERMKQALELSSDSEFNMDEFSYTLQVGREAMLTRVGFIANTRESIIEHLDKFLLFEEDAPGIYYHQINPIKDSAQIDEFNRDSHSKITQWLNNHDYSALLEAWVRGIDANWLELYSGSTPRKITLPLYPFEKVRCWIDYSPKVIPKENSHESIQYNFAQQHQKLGTETDITKNDCLLSENETTLKSSDNNHKQFDINAIIDKINLKDMTEDAFLEWIAEQ